MDYVVFEGSSLQVGDRIKIPKAIVDTLNLKKGEKVKILFDVQSQRIIVELVRRKK